MCFGSVGAVISATDFAAGRSERDLFRNLVTDLKVSHRGCSSALGRPTLEITATGQTRAMGLIVQFFLVIVGVTWLVAMIQDLYSSITSPGHSHRLEPGWKTCRDTRREPARWHQRAFLLAANGQFGLAIDTVAIIARDGTVEYKAQGSPFQRPDGDPQSGPDSSGVRKGQHSGRSGGYVKKTPSVRPEETRERLSTSFQKMK